MPRPVTMIGQQDGRGVLSLALSWCRMGKMAALLVVPVSGAVLRAGGRMVSCQ